ncbi:hypothetical protein PVAP13_3NG040570 [Panicum virgatum]|uniref:Uncharacterized protein n=1 Tax=Panicum virgatum TaxID=38727 RepID=A0A8T0TUU0_PANVG|nr:hypothetical protein PVAP13_3NG040570 [Panicum virgatum]
MLGEISRRSERVSLSGRPRRPPRRARFRQLELATDNGSVILWRRGVGVGVGVASTTEVERAAPAQGLLRGRAAAVRLRARRVPRQRYVPQQQPCRRGLPGSVVSAKPSGSARRPSGLDPSYSRAHQHLVSLQIRLGQFVSSAYLFKSGKYGEAYPPYGV